MVHRLLRVLAGDSSGSVVVPLALMLVFLLSVASLGTEIVALLAISRKMQSAADTAAAAAGTALLQGHPANYASEAFTLASAAGFVDGVGGTAVAVNHPPTSGSHATDANAIEVLISQPQTLGLASFFHPAPFVVSARAVATTVGGGACVLALNSGSTAKTLRMTGSTVVSLDCGVAVDSSSADAVDLVGGSTLTAAAASIVGGYQTSGGATFTATNGIKTGAGPVADPYAGIAVPSFSGCAHSSFSMPPGPSPASPGVYCNGLTVASGSLVLTPGVYIIDRGALTLQAGASLTGTGVTIVLTSSTGANYATASIAGNATLTLAAPTSGPTAGLAIFQDRNAPAGVTNQVGGGATLNVSGALYFPNQNLSFSGGAAAADGCTQVIAWQISFTGNSYLQDNCAGTGVHPIGGAIKLVE